MANDKDSSETKGGSSFFGGLGKTVKDGLGSLFGLGKENKPIKPLVDKPNEIKPIEPTHVPKPDRSHDTKPTFEPSATIDPSPSVEGKKNHDTGEEPEEVSGVRQFMKGRDYADFKSSNVASAKYAQDIGELQLGYKNGGKYRYHDVSPSEAKSFYNAGSKGKWVWDKLRVRGTVFGYRKPYEYMADESQGYVPKYHASETHRQEHHKIDPAGHTPQSWQQGQGPYRPSYGKPAKHAHPFPMGKQKVVGKLTTEEYEKKDKHKEKIPVAKHAPQKQSGPTAAEELASVFAMGERPTKAKKPFAKPSHAPMKTPETAKPVPAEPAKRAGAIGTGAISSVLGGIKAGAAKLGSLFGFGGKPKKAESPAKSAHKSNQDRQAKRKGQHKAEGGFVEHMADGGSPDTTQILADDGEIVVKDTEAKKPENAALLEAINSSKSPTLSAGGHSDVPTHQGESSDKSSGGEIRSKLGTPGLDNEPVNVKPDSFVVNANASKEFKPVLEAMNHGQDVAHRLDGGFVGMGQHLASGGVANGNHHHRGDGSPGVPDVAAPGKTESTGATQNPAVPSQVRSQESLSSPEVVSSPVGDAVALWKSLYARIADPSLTYPEIESTINEPFKKLTVPQLKEVGAGVGKTIMPGNKAKMVAQFVRMVKDQKENWERLQPRHKAAGGFVGHGQHLSGGGTAGGDKPAQAGFVGMGEKPNDKPVPTFYSRLQRAIQALGDKPIPAEAVKNRLKKAGKEGFSDEEWQWTGMDAALEGKKSVTRDELLKHFGENQVQVGEVVKGENLAGVPFNYRLYSPSGEPGGILTPSEHDEMSEETRNRLFSTFTFKKEPIHNPESVPKFSGYQTPGGDNYREMLLTLPQKTKPLSEKEEERYFDLQVGFESLSPQDANEFSQLSARKNKRLGEDFAGNHWDEPNVLAHIRMNDRIGKDGEKILHVEEIQSDWHQEGREKGYIGDPATKELRRKLVEERDALNFQSGDLFARIHADDYGSRTTPEGYAEYERRVKAYKEHQNTPRVAEITRKLEAMDQGVPNAPFKENWHELAMKRVIRHAAENDYARITLNSGEQINKVLNPGTGDEGSLQGQKAFYDTTLPNTMAKLGKPFGAKVEPYTISEAPPIADYDRFGNPVDKHGKQIKHDAEIGVTSLPITPELKKSAVGKGFSHMAKGGTVQHLATGGTAGGKSSGWLGKAFGAIGGMFGLGSHPEASGTQQIAPGQAVISPQEQAVQRSSDLPPTSIKQPPMAALMDDAADAEPTVVGGVAPYKWTPPEPSDWGAGLVNLQDNPPAELPIVSQLEKRKGPQSELRSFLRKHQPDGGIKLLPHNEALQNMQADEERIRREEEARKGFLGRLGFSDGGQVPGFPGVGENEDEVPAKLTKGEEVTRKEQAEKYRPLLKAINADQVPQGEELQRLAGGGGKKGGHGSFVASGAGDGWNHYDRGSEGENGVDDEYGGHREEDDEFNPFPKKVVNFGAPKPRAKAVRKTLHGIIMDKGGISAESLKTAGYNLDELKENGLGQLIRKEGGIPIDELTSSLHHAGHIAFPGAEHGSSKMPLGAEQFLLDQLEAKAHSLHADKDDEHEDEYEAYMREQYERQQYESEQQGGLAPFNQSLSNEYEDDRGDAYEDEFASPYKEGEVEPWNKSDQEIAADYSGFFNDEMKRQADKKKSQELQQWFNEETKQKKASPAKVDRMEKTQKQPLVSMAKKEEEKPAEPLTPINQPLKQDEQSSAEMQRIFDEKMRRESKAVSSVSQVSKPPVRLPAFDTETGQPIVGEEGRPEGPKESAEGWAKRAPSAVMKRIVPVTPTAPVAPQVAEQQKTSSPAPSVRPPSYNTETGQRLYGGEGQPEGPNESPEGWAKRAPAALAKRSGLSLVDHASEMPKQGPDEKLLDRANDAFAKLNADADKFPEHIKAITATFVGLQSAVKRFENAIADTSGTIAEQNVRKKYAESVLNEKLKAANESPVKGIGEVIAASIKDTLPGLLQSGLTGMAYKAGGPLAGIMAHPVAGAFAQHLDAQGEGGKGGIVEMLGSLFRNSKPEVGAGETTTAAAKPMAAVVQALTPVEPEKPVEQPKATVTGGWGGGWDDAKDAGEQPAESRAKPEEEKPGVFQRMKGWFAKGEEYKGGATVTSGWGGGWEDGTPANEQPAESRGKDDKEEPKKPGLFGRFKNWFGDGGKPPTGGGNTTASGGMGGGGPPGGGVPGGAGAAAEGGGGAMAAAGPAAIALGAALALNKAIDAVSGSLLGANDALIGFGTGLARSVGVPKEIADLGGAVANLFSPLRLAADGLKLFQFAAMPLLNLDKPGEMLKSTFTAIADVGKAFVAVLWSARDPVQMLTAAVSPFVNQVGKWNPAAIDRMNLAFDNLSAAAGRMFAPIITSVTGFADELNVLYTSIAPEMESLVQSVVDPIRDFGREFAVGFVGVVREGIPVFRGMMEDMKPLGPMVSAGIRLIMDGVSLFVTGAGQAVSFLTPIFTSIMEEVTPAFRVGAEIVRGLFQTFIGIKDAVMLVTEGLRPLFSALVTIGTYTNPVVFAFVTLAGQTKNLTAVFAASAGTLADIIRRLRESPTSPIRAIREGFAGFGARFDASLSRMNTPGQTTPGGMPLTGPTTTAAQQARHVGIEDVGLEARRAAYSQGADVASQTAANTAATVRVLQAIERLLQAGNVTAANAANFQNQLLAQQGVMS